MLTEALTSRRAIPCARMAAIVLCLSFLAAGPALAQLGGDPNVCDVAGESPDVIVGDLPDVRRWGKVGDITAFSVGTTSCNLGDCWLSWLGGPNGNENRHPVIAQNLYRLLDGRFEQIGQSWLKHGFFALNGSLCESGCIGTNGDYLGVNCSDPYSSNLNGGQTGLGPRNQVTPAKGTHIHPVDDISQTGNAIYKRLQVHDLDLDPSLNAGATYFIEGHYIAADDTGGGNDDNNASYRQAVVDDGGNGFYDVNVDNGFETVRGFPALLAWPAADGDVEIDIVDVQADGRIYLASRATDLGSGTWHYEYAIYNFNSTRAVGSFSVPAPTGGTMTNIGFHDVESHSGEPFDGTDWPSTIAPDGISWATETVGVNPDANAIRWGTLYNFRFDVNSPPAQGPVTIGLFTSGSPGQIVVNAPIPAVCNENSICDPAEECLCPLDCSPEGTDLDGDLVGQCIDCQEGDGSIWATPGEVAFLAAGNPGGTTTFTWDPPIAPGASGVTYEVLRSDDPTNFFGVATLCMPDADPSNTTIDEPDTPVPGAMYSYLVRAMNGCEAGTGPVGEDSSGTPRAGRICS